MKDDFNIHNWQADYYRKNVLKEETYGGRGSDVASVYQSAVQLSAEDIDQASWVLSRRTGN